VLKEKQILSARYAMKNNATLKDRYVLIVVLIVLRNSYNKLLDIYN